MEQMLHIRFEGRSFDIPLAVLDIGLQAGERRVRIALASYLDVAESRLSAYIVERHANGNLTVRPEAVFG